MESPPVLAFSERLAASLIFCFVLALILNNFSHTEPLLTKSEFPVLQEPLIAISVVGAVAAPGTYQVKKGATLGQVLAMASPLEEARIEGLKSDQRLWKCRTINVPYRKKGRKAEENQQKECDQNVTDSSLNLTIPRKK